MINRQCFIRGHDWQNDLSDERLNELHEAGLATWREGLAMKRCARARCDSRAWIYGHPPMPPILRAGIAAASLIGLIIILVGM